MLILPGTPRRKKKIVHQTAATDDKKLQSTLKKLAVNNIPGIEEVNLIKNDGSVIHFNNPKTQASLASNVFAITGHGEQKQVRLKFHSSESNLKRPSQAGRRVNYDVSFPHIPRWDEVPLWFHFAVNLFTHKSFMLSEKLRLRNFLISPMDFCCTTSCPVEF